MSAQGDLMCALDDARAAGERLNLEIEQLRERALLSAPARDMLDHVVAVEARFKGITLMFDGRDQFYSFCAEHAVSDLEMSTIPVGQYYPRPQLVARFRRAGLDFTCLCDAPILEAAPSAPTPDELAELQALAPDDIL